MFKLIFASLLIFSTALSNFALAQVPEPTPIPLDHAYVPAGFDGNDQVQLVVEGWFRASCYRLGHVQVSVDFDRHVIKLSPIGLMYGGMCLDVMVPFYKTVELGILPPGRYSVVQTLGGTLTEINVAPSTTGDPDDYLYASVSQAYLDADGSQSRIIISGEFSNSCMVMDEIKVTTEPEVIVVQPITKLKASDTCRRGRFPFEKVVPVKVPRPGRYLLHVRAMNGNAVNSLVDIH